MSLRSRGTIEAKDISRTCVSVCMCCCFFLFSELQNGCHFQFISAVISECVSRGNRSIEADKT